MIFIFRDAIAFDDILHSGLQEDYETLAKIERKIQMDDPVNIQFTSVSTARIYFLLDLVMN